MGNYWRGKIPHTHNKNQTKEVDRAHSKRRITVKNGNRSENARKRIKRKTKTNDEKNLYFRTKNSSITSSFRQFVLFHPCPITLLLEIGYWGDGCMGVPTSNFLSLSAIYSDAGEFTFLNRGLYYLDINWMEYLL